MVNKAQKDRAKLNSDTIITVRIPESYYDKLKEISFLRRTYISTSARRMIVEAVDGLMPE